MAVFSGSKSIVNENIIIHAKCFNLKICYIIDSTISIIIVVRNTTILSLSRRI